MNPIKAIRLYEAYQKILKQSKEMTMQNWKTTVCGAAAAALLALGNYAGPNTWQGYVGAAVIALLGALAKDYNVKLTPDEIAAITKTINSAKALFLVAGLGLIFMAQAAAQTATPPSTSTSNGFAGSSDAVAIDYAGAWSVGTLATESYDVYDFGAKKTNHLYLQGEELLAPTPGFNAYMGGIAIQPDFSSLFSKTNVPASNFSVFFNASIGNGIPSTGPSAITWLAGGGVKYQVTSSLTWNTLRADYGRFGSNGFPMLSTGLQFIFVK